MDNLAPYSEEIKTHVVECYEHAKSERQPIDDTHAEMEQWYDGSINSGSETDEMFAATLFSVVGTLHPRLASPYLDRDESFIAVSGRNPGDDAQAQAAGDLVWYFFNEDEVPQKIDDWKLMALKYKAAWMRTFWDKRFFFKDVQEPVTQSFVDPWTGQQVQQVVDYRQIRKRMVEYDGPSCELVDPLDIYPDPAGRDVKRGTQQARYIIERKGMYKEDIEELARVGYYDKKTVKRMLLEIGEGGGTYKEESQKQTIIEQTGIMASDKEAGKFKPPFEILEYWTTERQVVVCEEKYVLRDEENPFGYIPYIPMWFHKDPRQLWGLSVFEIIKTLLEIQNEFINDAKAASELSASPIAVMDQTMKEANKDFKVKAGAVLYTTTNEQGKNVQFTQFPGPNPATWQMIQMITSYIQETTRTTEYVRGTDTNLKTSQTATEVQTKTAQAETSFEHLFKRMSYSVLELAKHYLKMCQLFLSKPQAIEILDDQGEKAWFEVTPEDIQGDFKIRMTIDPMLSKDAKMKQNTLEALQIATGNPLFAQMPGMDRVAIELLEQIFESNKVKLSAPLPEILQQAKDEMMMQQQAMMEAQMGGMNAAGQAISGAPGDGAVNPQPGMDPFGGQIVPEAGAGLPGVQGFAA